MILDTLQNAGRYTGLSARFKKAFDYISSHDLASLPVGKYEIDGNDVYLMVQHMPLKHWHEGSWEAHRKYADIQLILQGRELLGVRPAYGMETEQEYSEEKDVVFFKSDAPGLAVPVTDNDFLVLFPEDAHRPCICREEAGSPMESRRAVLKVRL